VNQARLIRLELRQAAVLDAGSQYVLTVLNLGGRPVRLRLQAQAESDQISISLPEEVSVADGSEEEVRLTLTASRRRWFGGVRTLPFTVTAVAENDPAVAVSTAGEYEDRPIDWRRPAIAGIGAAVAVVAVAAALLLIGGRGKSHVAAGPPPSRWDFTATIRGSGGASVMPGSLCYHLAPENVPFHVVLSQALNGRGPATLDEWDDDGQNGGDCVIVPQMLIGNQGALSLQAWVDGARVGDVVLGAK
jgi:hypothetical protein